MDTLQEKISSLETEFTDLKGEIVSKDTQLEQRQETIESLVQAKEQLEKKIFSYRGDLETLMTAYDETKEEYSNAVKNMKNDKERESSSYQEKYRQLEVLATETQDELEKYVQHNRVLKSTLDESKSMIDELAFHKKKLEDEKADNDALVINLQEKWRNSLKEAEELKTRSSKIRIEKEMEINRHLDALDMERSDREELEAKVRTLEQKLEETKKQVKSTAELKAENFLLQDKVERQEAYLKRKLQKEKAMKDRKGGMMSMSMSSVSAAKPKTPPRPPSRSRSVTRRLSASRPSRITRPRSTSIKRSVSDELDELLDDEGEV